MPDKAVGEQDSQTLQIQLMLALAELHANIFSILGFPIKISR